MIAPDQIPTLPGLVVTCIGLWLWRAQVIHERRSQRRHHRGYWTLDCRDGRHTACATCNCECHL